MFVKRFFEPRLAQTSYLLGSKDHDEAIVIDPNRDIAQYVRAAEAEHVKIRHVTETHIHADYLSGARELAKSVGAQLYLSDEGDASWKYGFARDASATLLKNGDRLKVGIVSLEAVHTPGHTPEHLTYLVTDGASATEPLAAVTGDFLFVGDVGRPDLLERAANVTGTMEASARTLFKSLQQFQSRPEWLQIWPGHGAGSACGKSISDLPQSTLGYERKFNWAFGVSTEAEFVRLVLAGQPDPPKYFAEMKRMNRDGPALLNGFRRPPRLELAALDQALAERALVIDTRAPADFAVSHVPGTFNIPLDGSFVTWAGWFVPYTAEFFLMVDERTPQVIDAAVRDLALIGLDRVGGYFDGTVVDAWSEAGRQSGNVRQISPVDLQQSLQHSGVTLVDVRSQHEFEGSHIAGARHIPLTQLAERLDEIPRTRPIVVQCAAGARSSIAASLLRSRGVDNVINLTGGIGEWIRQQLPVQN